MGGGVGVGGSEGGWLVKMLQGGRVSEGGGGGRLDG